MSEGKIRLFHLMEETEEIKQGEYDHFRQDELDSTVRQEEQVDE